MLAQHLQNLGVITIKNSSKPPIAQIFWTQAYTKAEASIEIPSYIYYPEKGPRNFWTHVHTAACWVMGAIIWIFQKNQNKIFLEFNVVLQMQHDLLYRELQKKENPLKLISFSNSNKDWIH